MGAGLESRRSLRTIGSEVLVLVLSAFIYSFAFPGFMSERGIPFIALIAFIPIFAVIRNASWKVVWAYGFLYEFVFYITFAYWLKGFHALAIILIPFIKGFEMILCFLALKAADSFFKRFGYFFQAIIWVAYAYLSESWFAGFPYGNIAYALYNFRPFVQIADITGIWGIAFLAILPQPFLGRYLCDWVRGNSGKFVPYLKKNIIFVIFYIVLIIADLIYGGVRISEWRGKESDRVWDVVAVQHNHDSWKGGYTTYLHNFNNLRRFTLEAMAETEPDAVIWSETAFVPSVAWHTAYSVEGSGYEQTAALVDSFVSFATGLGVPLVTGNPEGVILDPSLPPILEDGSTNRMDYNTVILFDEGEIKETYRKQHLVPFTEYFPYEEELPWLYNLLLANDYNWWLQGTEPVVFNSDGVKFSTPICFEDVFGYLSAEFVANGADLIVNMSNDNWSKRVSAEMQHAAMGSMRAIETRKAVIRGTNSGITCLITPDGKMHDEMVPFEMGWKLYHVPVYMHESNPDTFYVRHIDLFAHIAVYASYGILIIGAVMKLVSVIRKKVNK